MKVDSAFQWEWIGFLPFAGFCKKYAPFSIKIRKAKQGKKPVEKSHLRDIFRKREVKPEDRKRHICTWRRLDHHLDLHIWSWPIPLHLTSQTPDMDIADLF